MRFYDALQMDPAQLKPLIRSAETVRERRMLQAAIPIRSILIVLFSIILIAPQSMIFGSENNPMAVAVICILLSVRFVDFGYCTRDALINMGITFLLLFGAPAISWHLHPLFAIPIHFVAFILILMITSDQPQMGNGGLYSFAYIFLVANPVEGTLLLKRAVMTLISFILCALIYFSKHRGKHSDVRFRDVALRFRLTDHKCQWQLRLALGISLVVSLGSLLGLERAMWASFACASMLGCYTSLADVKERFFHRMIGAVCGSALFMLIYQITPPPLHFLFGPLGGVCMGFCTDYRFKTAINCFGALMLATGLYGLGGSVYLRVFNNLIGAAFGFAFSIIYHKLVTVHFDPQINPPE